MQVIYPNQPIPNELSKSIFLAGPTPRKDKDLSWRFTRSDVRNDNDCLGAIDYLDKVLHYDGVVFSPESPIVKVYTEEDLNKQIDWEIQCMQAADCILFWIPRDYLLSAGSNNHKEVMLGLTTNVEFGRFLNSNKLILGSPDDAYATRYLKYLAKDKYKWHTYFDETLKAAVEYVKDPVYRIGAETKIPKHIFLSDQFQNWYKQQKESGNKLVDFHMEYEWMMPKSKKLFLAIWKPDVYIADEDRIKSNEFVIGRTDMSYICAYHEYLDGRIEIVVCEEFRSPVRNEKSKVFELPGGSSLNPKEDPLEVASHELEEETGLKMPPCFFDYLGTKQSASTLCSHQIHLFSIQLNKEEIDQIRNDHTTHGVTGETELIHLHVMEKDEAYKYMDWTNIGMVEMALQNRNK